MGSLQGVLFWVCIVGASTATASWSRRRTIFRIKELYHLIPKRPGDVGGWKVIHHSSGETVPCCAAHAAIGGPAACRGIQR